MQSRDSTRPRPSAHHLAATQPAFSAPTVTAASTPSAHRQPRSGLLAPAMGHPAVELVPPTPSAHTSFAQAANASRRASPSPQSSVETDTVDTLLTTTTTQRRRPSSSETTAVTIYSMYGDSSFDNDETVKLAQVPPSSFQAQQQGRTSRSSSRRRPGPGHTPSHSGHGSSAASIQLAYLADRPPSTADSSLAHESGHVAANGRTTPSGRLTPDAGSLRASAFTPPPVPKHLPQGAYLSPATLSHASIATSPTSVSHRSPSGSLSLSIRRAEAEDQDSFHVRATYAQLDVSGVPRDGVDDGIERTRARLGVSLDDVRNSSDFQTRGGDLDDKELAVLGSLDRYGFYRVDNHDRLVRVPAAALAKPLSAAASSSGPTVTPAQLALKVLPTDQVDTVTEVRRIAKWGRMLVPKARDQGSNVQLWAVVPRKENKLRERVYKGIPDRWRAAAWELLVRRFVGENRMDLSELAREYRVRIFSLPT